MAAQKKALLTFNVGAYITLRTDCNVNAATLEEALVVARTLNIHDFIDLKGEHNDSSLKIDSLFEN